MFFLLLNISGLSLLPKCGDSACAQFREYSECSSAWVTIMRPGALTDYGAWRAHVARPAHTARDLTRRDLVTWSLGPRIMYRMLAGIELCRADLANSIELNLARMWQTTTRLPSIWIYRRKFVALSSGLYKLDNYFPPLSYLVKFAVFRWLLKLFLLLVTMFIYNLISLV